MRFETSYMRLFPCFCIAIRSNVVQDSILAVNDFKLSWWIYYRTKRMVVTCQISTWSSNWSELKSQKLHPAIHLIYSIPVELVNPKSLPASSAPPITTSKNLPNPAKAAPPQCFSPGLLFNKQTSTILIEAPMIWSKVAVSIVRAGTDVVRRTWSWQEPLLRRYGNSIWPETACLLHSIGRSWLGVVARI